MKFLEVYEGRWIAIENIQEVRVFRDTPYHGDKVEITLRNGDDITVYDDDDVERLIERWRLLTGTIGSLSAR